MIARNSHNLNEAVILQQNPIKIYSEKRIQKTTTPAFHFRGSYLQLEAHLDGLTQQTAASFVEAEISVSGVEMQAFDRCCYVCTWVWGGLLLLPLILPCMDCWKRSVLAAESIDRAIYQKLAVLLKPNLKVMRLKVNDCTFNLEKAALLLELLQKSSLQRFAFENEAGEYDYEEESYSVFEENVRPMLKLKNFSAKLQWGGKHLQS